MRFLLATAETSQLILNAVQLTFVLDIDEMLYKVLSSGMKRNLDVELEVFCPFLSTS